MKDFNEFKAVMESYVQMKTEENLNEAFLTYTFNVVKNHKNLQTYGLQRGDKASVKARNDLEAIEKFMKTVSRADLKNWAGQGWNKSAHGGDFLDHLVRKGAVDIKTDG